MSEKQQQKKISKMESIINFKQLYYQEREKRIELQKLLELQRIKIKKMSHGSTRTKSRYCANCTAQLSNKKQADKQQPELIQGFKDFSQRIQEKLSSFRTELSSFKMQPSSSNFNTQPSLLSKLSSQGKRHVNIIENFSIFGTQQATIQEFIQDKKSNNEFSGEILHSKKIKGNIELQASGLIFPSGMVIKKYSNYKAKQKTIQLMSFCYTNLKCFVLSFQNPDKQFDSHFHENKLLNYINPDRRLYCICIGIHDYTWVQNAKNKLNISLGHIQGSIESINSQQEPHFKSQGHDNSFKSKQSIKSIEQTLQNIRDLQIGITQRVFCITSYFPFFTFYEDILRNLINIIKMQRLAIYKHNEQNIKLTIKQTDSKFQMERIIQLFDSCYKDLEYKKIDFNKEYQLRLINQQKITLLTSWDQAKVYFVRQWIYTILNMFTFDTFLDIFTLVMLQDRIVFICENSNILTHTIYLFTNVLPKPLIYPHPVISIIPSQQQQFLSAPFPVIYGLLKKRKSIEDRNILDNYDNTYVFLSPDKLQICYQEDRKKLLSSRSTKLNNHKELKELFKQLKKTRKKQQKSVKYEIQTSDYCILASNQQKQKGIKIVQIITSFMKDQIVSKIPNDIELQNLKKKIDPKLLLQNKQKDEHSIIMSKIASDIKKNTKDPFIHNILSTQMINNFMFN